jgi:N-acetylmuramoyl-L-alanine amidase
MTPRMPHSDHNTRVRPAPRLRVSGRRAMQLAVVAATMLLAASALVAPPVAGALPTSPTPDLFGHGSAAPAPLAPLVFIDAGHGGPYSNANVNGVREKDVNLAIALELANVLRADGLRVQVDRTTDTALALWDVPTWHWVSPPGMWRFIADGAVPRDVPYDDLQARVDMANQAGADVFVAIHNNGVSSPAARGTETYGPSVDGLGRRLAWSIQAGAIGRVGSAMDRGAKVEDFYVIRWANMPAALVEAVFLTNPTDIRLVTDAGWRATFERGVADGIESWLAGDPAHQLYPRLSGVGGPALAASVAGAWTRPGGTVVLASSADSAWAMAASPLSRSLDAPVLVSDVPTLSPAAATVLARLRPSRILAVGDAAAVPEETLLAAASAAGSSPALERTGGRTPAHAAAAVAGRIGLASRRLVVARSDACGDLATAAALAARSGSPLLLAGPGSTLPTATAGFIAMNLGAVAEVLAVGDVPGLPSSVPGLMRVRRVSGADVFVTNTGLMRSDGPGGIVTPVVADASDPDACVAAALYAGRGGQPLLLTGSRVLPSATREYIEQRRGAIASFVLTGDAPKVPFLLDRLLAKAAGGPPSAMQPGPAEQRIAAAPGPAEPPDAAALAPSKGGRSLDGAASTSRAPSSIWRGPVASRWLERELRARLSMR